jgi:hypothetical protein
MLECGRLLKSEENEMMQILAQTKHVFVETLMASLALIWLGRMVADPFLSTTEGRKPQAEGQ